MKGVNVYDFDGTIYDGDSSIDFFKFALKKKPKIIFRVFRIELVGIAYILKIKEKEDFKSVFFGFVRDFNNINEIIAEFWKSHGTKIKAFYREQHKNNDVVISASPEFLLEPVAREFDFELIATQVNEKTGKLITKNCYGEEKVKRIKKVKKTVDKFYSDSLSDAPLANIASRAFMVRGEKIIPWEEYKPSLIKKLKNFVFDRSFITFVAIGCINALNGIVFALIYRSFIETEFISYTCGFVTSVIIAYLLNSKFNFKKKINFVDCCKYILGNIPNYLIQILTVFFCIGVLGWNRVLVYALAAVVSVPVTFIIVKVGVFRKKTDDV